MSLPTRIAPGLAAVAVAVAGWFFLAPPLFGGQTTYVVTRGISMQPKFHTGDLVLLRSQPDYHVGEIVAYHSDELDRTVMHRIIGFDGRRFRFKGDNNDFVDVSQPVRSELIGRYWVAVPKVGLGLAWASDRRHAPFVLGAALLIMLGGGAGGAARRRRGPERPGLMLPAQWVRTGEQPPGAGADRPTAERVARLRADRPQRLPETIAFPAAVVAAAFAAVAVSAGVIALAASGHARTLDVTVPGAYTIQGTFSYGARVPRSTVYPTGRLATGDPIFVRLVPRVGFAFAYSFSSPYPHGIRGIGSFDAVISTPQGWQRTLRLGRRQPIAGDKGRIVATLDLAAVKRVVAQFESLTGITQPSYTVTLQPRLQLQGGVLGTVLKTSFAPTAQLTVDEFQLSVAQPVTLGNGPAPDPLTTSLSGSVERSVPATLGLGIGHASVRSARNVGGLIALVAALAALLAGGVALYARRAVREDEDAQIEREYADWIVPIASGIAPGSAVIELEDMESLVQIAEHYERMVLRERTDEGFAYVVEEAGTVYRYVSGKADSPASRPTAPDGRFPRMGESSLPETAEEPVENPTGTGPRR